MGERGQKRGLHAFLLESLVPLRNPLPFLVCPLQAVTHPLVPRPSFRPPFRCRCHGRIASIELWSLSEFSLELPTADVGGNGKEDEAETEGEKLLYIATCDSRQLCDGCGRRTAFEP